MESLFEEVCRALGLGLGPEDLGAWHMVARAVVVYVATIAMVRIGEKRFMGRSAAFDVILGIMLGSVVSRAITGNAAFGPTLVAGLALVLLHWVFAAVAFRSHAFGALIKGDERQLIKDGEIQWENMQKSHISERDLREAVRSEGQVKDISQVQEAHLERSGRISVVPKPSELRVVEVSVREGVQTVRIEVS